MRSILTRLVIAMITCALVGCLDPANRMRNESWIDQDIGAGRDHGPTAAHPQRAGPDEPIGADPTMVDQRAP